MERRTHDSNGSNGLELDTARVLAENGGPPAFTLRDLLAVGFRRRRLVVGSFLTIFLAVSLFVLLRPAQYESQMQILVKRERVDPLVTSEESAQRPYWMGVTEEELNSEAELLKGRDLLTQVVVAAGLPHHTEPGVLSGMRKLLWRLAGERKGEDPEVGYAVRRLEKQLKVKPLRKSNVIQVNYASAKPELSAAVLGTLSDRYLEKHLAVHRPWGAFDFFDREAERYATQLEQAHARMSELNREEGLVSVQAEKENALRRLGELEEIEDGTQARTAEAAERLRVLEARLASTPARATTEVHSGSTPLLEELHSMLVVHELKRVELLSDFQPDYPPVVEVEAQIAALRDAIATAEQSPLREETTNRNPTHDYLVTEVAKSRADLAGLQAHAAATAQSISLLREEARRLEEIGVVEQGLVRETTQAEQSYLAFSRKREEARIADALDAQRILNVAIAEEPTVPFEPSGPRRLTLMALGALCACLVSVALACAADYFDPSFRIPREIEAALGHRVLATIPALPTNPYPSR